MAKRQIKKEQIQTFQTANNAMEILGKITELKDAIDLLFYDQDYMSVLYKELDNVEDELCERINRFLISKKKTNNGKEKPKR